MNTFAVVFSAIIVVASANVAGRTGWSGPASLANLEIALGAAGAAAGSGNALANQQVLEVASGDANVPASITSFNGISAVVESGEGIEQLGVANTNEGSSATLNDVLVYTDTAGSDTLQAAIQGANLASVENSAGTDANGEGAIAAEANTLNLVNGQQAGSGWGQ